MTKRQHLLICSASPCWVLQKQRWRGSGFGDDEIMFVKQVGPAREHTPRPWLMSRFHGNQSSSSLRVPGNARAAFHKQSSARLTNDP